MTSTPSSRPLAGTSPETRMIEAAKSLAPHKAPHGHRPDWQTARDDQAESQRGD